MPCKCDSVEQANQKILQQGITQIVQELKTMCYGSVMKNELESFELKKIASFLLDQALMQAQLRVGSMLQVPLIQTVERAFQDIEAWLHLIAGGENVPVVSGAIEHCGFRYERDSRSLTVPDIGHAVLLADHANDLEKQVEDCKNSLSWLERLCGRTLSVQCDRSFEHDQWALRTTQLLIKIRSLLEQTLVRFLTKCMVWTKGVPAAFPACSNDDVKDILKANSEDTLKAAVMRFIKNKRCSDGTAGKCYLADEFPDVWKALRALYSHDQTSCVAGLKGVTNILKHARPLTFRNWFGEHGVEIIDDEERI